MYYLVDYENVNEYGLTGCEYLTPNDTVILFYNAEHCKLMNSTLRKIFLSGCKCECYRLVQIGNNAVDFYICTKAGELLGSGQVKKLAVISGDHGYQALKDYWLTFGSGQRILINPTIESVIIELNESRELIKKIKRDKQQSSVGSGVEKLEFLNKIWAVSGGGFTREDVYRKIELIFDDTTVLPMKQRELYTRCLKQFGHVGGLKVYNDVKTFALEKGYVLPGSPSRITHEQRLKFLIKASLKDSVQKDKARESIADYILEGHSKTQVNNFVMKRYKGVRFHEIMNALNPFISGKSSS